jgi:hypothetical protein
MATQFLNADAPQVSLYDLLGYSRLKTTQRYRRVPTSKYSRTTTRPGRWCCRGQDEYI